MKRRKTEVDVSNVDEAQRRTLWTVLAINAAFFAIGCTVGVLSHSLCVVADGLDMLADALVYGMSIAAVGTSAARKGRVALWSGILLIGLAAFGLVSTAGRLFETAHDPDHHAMIGMAVAALTADLFCLWLVERRRSGDANMRASLVFSAVDVIEDLGVIVAGALVWITGSHWPDVAVGFIVYVIVLRSGINLLRLAR